MILEDSDRYSGLWKRLSAHLEELLEKDRRELEKTGNGIDKTQELRGRIKVLRQLIAIGQEPKRRESDDH